MSKLTDLAQTVKKMKKEFKKTMEETGTSVIKETVREMFETFPDLEGLQWTQYTPYFNDGEACVFGVGEVRYRVKGVAADAGDYEDGYISEYSSEHKLQSPDLRKAVDAFAKAISDINDGMELIFGDHVKVTIKRDGIKVSDYDHD